MPEKGKPIVVGDNSILYFGCIILKGVIIGKNCKIGAGSVVTKNVPSGEVWVGNPAKLIKRVF